MNDKVKDRIDKDAEEERLHVLSIQYRENQYEQIAIGKDKVAAITASLHAQVGFEHGYKAAKAAERPKAWNEAIESVKEVLQELELKECEYKECAVPENLNYEYFKGKRDAYEFSVKLIRRALEWQGEKLKHKQP